MTDLSNKYRPKSLETFIGQSHIIGKDKALYNLIKKRDIPHLFFYAKPGTGKTTLAKIIAREINTDYYYFNATSIKIEDLRKVFDKYSNSLIKPLIFIDEVHRLSKNQQEVLLPIMENYDAIIIGASTENPFFTLTSAIRSRSFLYEFKPFTKKEMQKILDISLNDLFISPSTLVGSTVVTDNFGGDTTITNKTAWLQAKYSLDGGSSSQRIFDTPQNNVMAVAIIGVLGVSAIAGYYFLKTKKAI